MPEGFLFDTVTCSRWRRGDRILRRRIEALPMDAALYTSVMSVGELSFGIHNAPYEYQERQWQRTREILARFQSILEVTREVADRYGTLREPLRRHPHRFRSACPDRAMLRCAARHYGPLRRRAGAAAIA